MTATRQEHAHEWIDVVCGIVTRYGRLLAAQRGAGRHQAGLWEFPGGKLHDGESAGAGLERELSEELGIRVAALQVGPAWTHDYPDRRIRLIPVVARLEDGTLRLTEHQAAGWFSESSLRALRWAAADRPILEWALHAARGAAPTARQ